MNTDNHGGEYNHNAEIAASPIPLNETYWAFGDGSETAGGVFYGLVLFPEPAIGQVQLSIETVKLKHGGKANSPVSLPRVIQPSRREKTEWGHYPTLSAWSYVGTFSAI